ncbi:hypothetical protein [Clostridium sp.]|uniref:hypothetical protein n=1 Tax=Clostridium sp. TaxID=1506 RepID=UPI003D6CB419
MKVETIIKEDGKTRYISVNDKEKIIVPVVKFIKYRDNVSAASPYSIVTENFSISVFSSAFCVKSWS